MSHTSEIAHTLGAIDTDPRAKGGVFVDPDHVPHRDRTRVPWAFVFSLLILVGFEIWLHVSHWPKKIPYRLDLDEYYAVAATLDRHDPADITIIGSSRARESIDVPVLRGILRRETGQHLSVANYGVGGGRAYVFESIARQILRAKHLPRVIILGTAERDFGNAGDIYDQAPIYWNFDDWKAEYNRRGVKVLDDLPTVIRSYIGKVYLTLGYREQLSLKIRQILAGERDTLSQLDGELTPWQRTNPNRSIATQPPKADAVRAYVKTLSHGAYPNHELVNAMDRLARACRSRHVRLIVYQAPIPKILTKYVPKKMEDSYLKAIKHICAANGAKFIRPDQLKLKLGDQNFRDPSHLNLSGAERLSTVLAQRFLVPLLRDATTQPTTAATQQ